jgi:hypothetical protein
MAKTVLDLQENRVLQVKKALQERQELQDLLITLGQQGAQEHHSQDQWESESPDLLAIQ